MSTHSRLSLRVQPRSPAATLRCRSCLFPVSLLAVALVMAPGAASAQPVPSGQADASPPPGQTASESATLSLEQLLGIEVESVFGASKTLQKTTEAPASVTIVTAEEIERFGWRTLGDVLRTVRGYYVANDRNYSYPGSRGFQPPGDYNSRLLVTVDGMRLNDNIYDGALFDEDLEVELDAVDRVEIIRGPSSSLYGSSAFFGVINLITKTASHGPRASVTTAVGTESHVDTRGQGRHMFANGAALVIRGAYVHRGGAARLYSPEYDSPDTNGGIAEDLDYTRRRNVFGRFDVGNLSISGIYNERVHGIPNAAYGSLFNRPASNLDAHGALSAAWERALGRGWAGVFKAGYDHYVYKGSYTFEGETPGTEDSYIDRAIGQRLNTEVQFSRTFARHQFTGGLEHRDNVQQDQFSYIREPYEPLWYDDRSSRTTALYVQDQWRLSSKVLLNGGVRLDHYSQFKDPLKPRVAVILQPTARTTVKAIYGGAFRAPSAYENYYEIPGLWAGRPDLKPEQISTVEGIVEHYAGKRLRLSANVYRNSVTDLITMTHVPGSSDVVYYSNAQDTRATGAEVEAEARWPGGLRARASYAFAATHVVDSEESVPNSPRHVVQALASIPVGHGVFASVDVQALSRRRSLAGAVVDGYIRPNLALTGRAGQHGRVTFTMSNVTNTAFSDPVGDDFLQDTARQPGRVARLQFSWAF